MIEYPIEVIKVRDAVTIHQKVGGYTNGYNIHGTNDVYVYWMPPKIFCGIQHSPIFDKWLGMHHLTRSFSPKNINANYLALLLNSDITEDLLRQFKKDKIRVSVDSFFSSLLVQNLEREIQDSVGFVEVMRQFLMQNDRDQVFNIAYPSLKLGMAHELADAIADEISQEEHIRQYNLAFIQPWMDIYRNIPISDYTNGENHKMSEIDLLYCIEMVYSKLTAPRNELYANLMRYRIVRRPHQS